MVIGGHVADPVVAAQRIQVAEQKKIDRPQAIVPSGRKWPPRRR